MICPYCATSIHPVGTGGIHGMRSSNRLFYNSKDGEQHTLEAVECPACGERFLTHAEMKTTPSEHEQGVVYSQDVNKYVLLPRTSGRKPLPPEVPEPYRRLYVEAALILQDSPRASAALSRRCLQHLLRELAKASPSDLYHEIEWVLTNAGLPSYVTESLHDLRVIGNMAAHPNKSTATGDYVEVEPGEAEWTLDTLDALFGHYFIEPARTAARKAALAAKTGTKGV
jgi:hypothetical protein